MKTALIHIPHSSTIIPDSYLPLFLIRGAALRDELLRMTDWYTDDLFSDCGTCLTFPVSRLLCDVERFRDPAMECMTARGMWVCYERASDQTPLKTVTPDHCREILKTWYDRHHARLTAMTRRALNDQGAALIVDAHSFSSVRLPYETAGGARPDICIGTDPFHTPPSLTRACAGLFSALGYTVAVDRPFSGCLIPMAYYRRERRVQGVMIEVNRRLYMKEGTAEKTGAYETVRRDLTAVIRQISRE